MFNIFLKPTGYIVALDADGKKVEQYDGKPWTEVLPVLLKAKSIKWYFGDMNCEISKEAAQYLWLSICRDEDLIAASIAVVREHEKTFKEESRPYTAYERTITDLRNCLKMRGRIT